MSDSFDRASRLNIDGWLLDQLKFKKTASDKIAVRVGNEEDSPLYVTLTEGTGESDLLVYDEAVAVAKDLETKIVEYIVPPSTVLSLDKISASGENIGKYTVKKDGAIIKTKRTNYGSSLNVDFDFNSYELVAGEKLEVFITQVSLQGSSNHEATIEGKIKNV